MSKVYAVILAGGKGLRLGADIPKQFLPLGKIPVILWSIKTFSEIKSIDHIIIVSPEDELERLDNLLKEHPYPKILKTISGGTTRQGSAHNALTCCDFNDNDIIIFHDAARPFITADIIENCIDETRKNGAAGVYIPATDTITEIESGEVKSIPARENLFYTQTPQCFQYHIIRDAHERALKKHDKTFTDDVSMVIDAGYTVVKVEGHSTNFKITNAFDYELAKWNISRSDNG